MLKLQYLGHLIRRADSLEKTLMLGKTEGRRRGQQKMRRSEASPTEFEQTLEDSEGQGSLTCSCPWATVRGLYIVHVCTQSDMTQAQNKNNYQFSGKYMDKGTEKLFSKLVVPSFLGTRDWCPGRQFFYSQGLWMWLLDDSRVLYLLCMYFYHYYIVMYNEIIIQVNMMQNH